MAKYWMGEPPEKCDGCEEPLKNEFYDAKTRMGPWGCFCPDCFDVYGLSLGMGFGQHYVKRGNKFLKLEG